jgi:hypothetical protein
VPTDGHDAATAPRRPLSEHLLLRPRRTPPGTGKPDRRLAGHAEGDFGPDSARAFVQLKTAPGTVADNLVIGPETPAALDVLHPNRLAASEAGYRTAASGRNIGNRRSDWPSAADYSTQLQSAQLVDWLYKLYRPFIKTGFDAPRVGDVTTVMKNLNGSFHDRIFFAEKHVSPGFFGYIDADAAVRAVRVAPGRRRREELGPVDSRQAEDLWCAGPGDAVVGEEKSWTSKLVRWSR